MVSSKVAIVGAGPAGISTAVQLKRYKINSLIFEKDKIGGLVENAHRIENTMLFPEGISGKMFVKILEDYVKKYDIDIIYEEVKKVKMTKNFVIVTEKGRYEFEYLVIATGTRPKKLPFEGIKYHITEINPCDKLLIIGGGDIAFDYALSARKMCKDITILYRSTIKALPILVDEVIERGITVVKGEIKSIKNHIAHTSIGKIEFDEILGAIGRIPNVEIVEDIASSRMFIIGDAKNGVYRQTSLAIADGVKTGMKIWRMMRYGNFEGNW
ncbi:NAD(P)/FAD-dependent oxidoreductase [Candidatus Aciduliprofundum boonei]|uniref:FAD-dependent pyridine nucleotide-disulfide oxidoreductase n=1 Tax=Aciduliprofundum boonei (strain DSM 19572 / T469) TaxID=439481 RepID=B5ICL8_ACIB4|nr:NAD(P)/FAD-dependent oxidoreductase [Candidatus Aciduliprofundum boonei]ADD09097.1 FAD-dependent pyridine nucleotide-disulfide oxidoreductase [Aciduliprofundum boonei T469]EDY35994.1 Pyridine nucleotide-disulphide oxidoreductase, putative [Aciduliprofundum boonei T469]HII55349.1 NAD(P)/FAD-dependent oxidoreductase [Candidatus Aciduliprofundum boonei]